MEIPEREPMLSLDQAARYLQKSYSWLYANFRRLDIPVYRIGGRWYFQRIEIDRWLSERQKHRLWRRAPALNSSGKGSTQTHLRSRLGRSYLRGGT